MKSMVLVFLGVVCLLASGLLLQTSRADRKKDAVLRHVVLFKFKPDVTSQQIDEAIKKISQLREEIPEVQSLEWGLNISQEGRSKGFTHCFLLTFQSQEDLDRYLPHPAHQAFVKLALPWIEDVTVVDYWTE